MHTSAFKFVIIRLLGPLLFFFSTNVQASYPLDSISRHTNPTGPVKCPNIKLDDYSGSLIEYTKHKKYKKYKKHKKYKKETILVHPSFREKLKQFEKVVVDTAITVYGRKPYAIKHAGGYKCRRIGGYPHLLSEHSFGNAIDVSRFYFPAIAPGSIPPVDLPKSLHKEFEVSLLQHWNAKHKHGGLHREFLRQLARNLIESNIFRVLLGPAFPNHHDHFHLDYAKYQLVSIFKNGEY